MTRHGANSEVSDSTSASLIRRVRDHEPEAWRRLADIYSPLVYSWARRSSLSAEDAADSVQEVFRLVHRGLCNFQREQTGTSFRGWLRTITLNVIRAHYRRAKPNLQAAGGTEAALVLQQLPADVESESEVTVQEQRRMLHRALNVIRDDFNETTWQAFHRTTLENAPAPEVARELGMTPAAVRQARHRVLRRLREELDDQIQE